MKIFLADPHPQVRSALELVLSQIPGASVSSDIENIYQLLILCSQECPDLILIDPELVKPHRRNQGTSQRMESFALIHRICPGAKVVAMSSRFEVEQEALASGADGFISKTEPPEILREKINRLWNT
jgi:DNA-binding NarL/FixJ family response regulator